MDEQETQDIDAKVKKALDGTPYAVSRVRKLTGGSVNWIYHAPLLHPLDDGTAEIAIKHGERWMASKPEFELNFVRSHTEAQCLENQHGLPPQVVDSLDPRSIFWITVRTPKLYLHDEIKHNQIMEWLPYSIDFKSYILEHFPPQTSELYEPQARQLGKSIGRWRSGFGKWAAQKPELRKVVAENKDAKAVRHMVHFTWLAERVKEYPHLLGDVADVFAQVEQMAAAEAQDESKLEIIHGDFWTGNLILPNFPIHPHVSVSMFVIDWEMAQLNSPAVDLGEMIAEFLALWLYKRITAALWILEGFVEGLGEISEELAFRTALQAGAHLVCITPTLAWGDQAQVEEVVKVGTDVIVNAWRGNREWFEGGELASLFRNKM